MARIKVVVSRHQGAAGQQDILEFDGLAIDMPGRQAGEKSTANSAKIIS